MDTRGKHLELLDTTGSKGQTALYPLYDIDCIKLLQVEQLDSSPVDVPRQEWRNRKQRTDTKIAWLVVQGDDW